MIPADASEDDKDRLASRQANAILLLHEMGNDEPLWPALEQRADPRLRSFLIRHFHTVPSRADDWNRRLAVEKDPGIRQALILLLGSPANATPSGEQDATLQQALIAHLPRRHRLGRPRRGGMDPAAVGLRSAARTSPRRAVSAGAARGFSLVRHQEQIHDGNRRAGGPGRVGVARQRARVATSRTKHFGPRTSIGRLQFPRPR